MATRGRHWNGVTTVVFSPDGKFLATTGHALPIHIWDAATLDEVRTIAVPPGQVGVLAFSPDGRRLAASITVPGPPASNLKIWDTTSGRELSNWSYPGRNAHAAGFSPNGDTITLVYSSRLTAGNQSVHFRTWETAKGKEIKTTQVANSWMGRLSANGVFGLSTGTSGWKHWDLAKGTSDLEGTGGPNRGMPLTPCQPMA